MKFWTLLAFCKNALTGFLAKVFVKLWVNLGHLTLLVGNNTKLCGSYFSSAKIKETSVLHSLLSVRNCTFLSKTLVRFKYKWEENLLSRFYDF